ncbi:slr1658 superfamily regulator [Leptospira idonii]|uniref:ATP-binding protein n=1 Tax=Leptospira idonii TaxID=1193500 RepID=A0A4R9LU53_9LEPT|nr:ATP-binding protein [Leptospira idonii]TGN17325.1 ATP-binding protein [Leptospira idonii]
MRKYGNLKSEHILKVEPESKISVHLKPLDLMAHWRRIGILSDFIGYFYGFSFVSDSGTTPEAMKSSEIVNSISTVFNELLENAAKYSFDKKADIDIDLIHRGNAFEMVVINRTNDKSLATYEINLKEIFEAQDLDELYIQKLELNENDPHHSGIGLVMILKDYPIEMEVIIENSGDISKITSRVLYFTT